MILSMYSAQLTRSGVSTEDVCIQVDYKSYPRKRRTYVGIHTTDDNNNCFARQMEDNQVEETSE